MNKNYLTTALTALTISLPLYTSTGCQSTKNYGPYEPKRMSRAPTGYITPTDEERAERARNSPLGKFLEKMVEEMAGKAAAALGEARTFGIIQRRNTPERLRKRLGRE